MKYKRVWSLVTACVLSAALINGCGGGSPASAEAPEESGEETAVSEENTAAGDADEVEASDSDAAYDSGSIEVADAAIDCSFELDGKKYTLPLKPQDLIADGWIDYYEDLGDELSGTDYTQRVFYKNDKEGNMGPTVNVWFYNNTGSVKKISECMISGIYFEQGTLEKCSFSLGNGLKPGDDPAAVTETMGTPYYTDDESNPRYFYYGEDKETGQIRFEWDKDNPSKSYILIEYYPAAEIATSEEVPEYLSRYKAPAAMGEDFDSGTFLLGGTLYQLPCPVSELIGQGWTLEDTAPIPGRNANHVKITKDDVSLYVTLANFAEDQTLAENCAVISVQALYNDGSNPDLELPKGATTDLDRSTLDSITESSSMEFESSELSNGNTFYQGHSTDYIYDCNFQYNNSEDRMDEIVYRFNSDEWPW